MDIITLALAKKFATKISAGYSKVEVDGRDIIFTLNDGSQVTLTVPTPADGVSVTDLDINENNELICTMSDGTTINAGEVPVADLSKYAKIEYVDEENEKLKEELEHTKMIYNALPKVSDEDTKLTLDNTAECPFYEVGLKPSELEQETTSGKNLFSGYIKGKSLNPTTGAIINSSSSAISDYIEVDFSINTDYYLSGLTETLHSWIGAYNSNKEFLGRTKATSKTDVRLTSSSFTSGTPQGTGEIVYLAITQYVLSGTSTGTIDDVDNLKTQLEIGTTATGYEEYTGGRPSPNPDYPQNIHIVSGDNTIIIKNKNLAKSDWAESFVNAVNDSGRARLEIKNNRSCLYYIAQAGYGDYEHKNLSLGTTFKENTQYTISYDILKTNSASKSVGIHYTDGTVTAASNVSKTNTWEHQTITSDSNKTIDYIQPYYTSGFTYIDINTWQVEEGTIATAYEEHKEQSLPISLGDLEHCKIGDYEDVFFKNVVGSEYYDNTLELDKWYLKKNTNKKIFNGTESWSYSTTYKYFQRTDSNLHGVPDSQNVKSKYFGHDTNFLIRIGNNQNLIWLFDYNGYFNGDTNVFKNWLSTHNTPIYYPMNTSTNILLNNTLQTQLENLWNAFSYQDQTNVSQTNNDLSFIIKLSAIKDISSL